MSTDTFRWDVLAHVDKYDAAKVEWVSRQYGNNGIIVPKITGAHLRAHGFDPDEWSESKGNLLTRQGRKRIIDRLVETAANVGIKATTGRIGVGNGTTAFADTQTDLTGASKQFELFDSAPTVGTGASSGVMTCVATFETGDANFAWDEWGIDGGTADGATVTTEGNTTPGLINRKVAALGTKTSAASWVFTVTVTIT